MKKCNHCNEEKEISDFHNSKNSVDGKSRTCKKCRSDINKKSYFKHFDNNKEKRSIQNEERKEYKSQWYKKDKEENYDKYRAKWTGQNKKRKGIKAQWFQENKERIIKKTLIRRNTIPMVKINHLISSAMLKSLKGNKKGRRWEELVGYTLDDLINHLFSNIDINIDEYNSSIYHIDHIIPINSYKYQSYEDEEFKKCWSYRNLRIVKAEENMAKKDKLDKKLILEYNIEDLLPKEVRIENI